MKKRFANTILEILKILPDLTQLSFSSTESEEGRGKDC